ncbi:MAG: CHAP domain-containing protein, partial [Myxococcaceae bacterium]
MRKAAAIGLLALLASACATSRPAPIAYAATRPPAEAATPRAIPPPLLPAAPDTSTPFIIPDQPHSECVPYARNVSGVQIWGDAVTWWQQAESKYVRSTRPAEGSVLV